MINQGELIYIHKLDFPNGIVVSSPDMPINIISLDEIQAMMVISKHGPELYSVLVTAGNGIMYSIVIHSDWIKSVV